MFSGPLLKIATWTPKKNTPTFGGIKRHALDTPFTLSEFDAVLGAQKNNKTPGPDNCRPELVEWLSETDKQYLLELDKNTLILGIFSECFCLADIAACYKNGDTSQMKNYRPIALLQAFYKILASLVRNRFQPAFESWIQRTQFGFRPKKSIAQAILIAQRLLDISEREATYLGTLLSDSTNNHREVSNRLAPALATCKRMKLFWHKANTTIR